ncbi:hypothetical protein A7E77_16915 (plasmid) [Sphingomonas sp. NIC1]|jgi:hypothetical protein|nr:hypothetical protein A7E77_16915 [Sphingomonas sp. NIC1]
MFHLPRRFHGGDTIEIGLGEPVVRRYDFRLGRPLRQLQFGSGATLEIEDIIFGHAFLHLPFTCDTYSGIFSMLSSIGWSVGKAT